MLEYVATGVAIADAHPDVLTASDMIIPRPAEGGLALAFAALGLVLPGDAELSEDEVDGGGRVGFT